MLEEIKKILPEKNILQKPSLKKLTTFKIGGNADLLLNIDNVQQLIEIIKILKKENIEFFLIGNGSNILASDKGFQGVLLKLEGEFLKISTENEHIYVGAGVKLRNMVNFSVDNKLAGAEFLAGIPGTLGGAVYMNAGAYGGELKDILVSIKALNLETLSLDDIEVSQLDLGYRKSLLQKGKYVAIELKLKLQKGNREKSLEIIKDLMDKRKAKQPVNLPSAGSFFKRPEGYFAGKLVQDAGLKGFSVGDAQVSELHSGFVVNKGEATAKDVVELMEIVQKKVYYDQGVLLKPEVIFLGDF